MRIEIDKYGNLFLERGGRMKDQVCPRNSSRSGRYVCGDWCPLFREPCEIDDEGKKIELGLCECYIHCKVEDFTDKRGK